MFGFSNLENHPEFYDEKKVIGTVIKETTKSLNIDKLAALRGKT